MSDRMVGGPELGKRAGRAGVVPSPVLLWSAQYSSAKPLRLAMKMWHIAASQHPRLLGRLVRNAVARAKMGELPLPDCLLQEIAVVTPTLEEEDLQPLEDFLWQSLGHTSRGGEIEMDRNFFARAVKRAGLLRHHSDL